MTLPPNALACPWCDCPAVPGPVAQSCAGCRRRFTLSAGPALDGSVIPAPYHPAAMRIALKWSMVVTYGFATLEPPGINSGTLDPVLAVAPVEQTSIAYGDVVSIAVWRKVAWGDCIAATLIPAPLSLLLAVSAILAVAKAPGVAAVCAAIAIALGLLAAWLYRRGIVIGRRQARIVGRWASARVPFDTSPAFHEELFRRCGIARPPVP
jgi:uncharacterized membrane protein (DUF441 family)